MDSKIPLNNKIFVKNRRLIDFDTKQRDSLENRNKLAHDKFLGSSMDKEIIQKAEYFAQKLPDMSLDQVQSIRQALNRSQMNKNRNYKLSRQQDSGSRNRFNLGTDAMWSKLSSKLFISTQC